MQNFNRKIKIFRPFLSAILAVSFLFTPSAGSFAASLPGNLVSLSAPFSPPALLGIQIYPQDPLKFSFLVGQGTASIPDTEMRAAVEKAVRYFLTGLAVPEDDLWVTFRRMNRIGLFLIF